MSDRRLASGFRLLGLYARHPRRLTPSSPHALEGLVLRDELVTVHLGGDISHHRRITIDAKRVTVEQVDGVDQGVAIESKDGHTTRLAFRSP